MYRLPIAGYPRQHRARAFEVHRVIGLNRREVRYRHTIQQDILQLYCSLRCFLKENRIGVGSTLLRLHTDTRCALAIGRGDGYLLPILLIYRNNRAGCSGKFDLVGKHVLVEIRQRVAVQVNHLQESILRFLHYKGDGVGPLRTAGSSNGQRMDIALCYAQHFLRLVGFFERHFRHFAHAFRQEIGIVQGVFVEALQRHAVQVNH